MHTILYGPFQQNADGSFKPDSDGNPKPDKRAGSKKHDSDITAEERRTLDDQKRIFDGRMRWQAAQLLGPIEQAKQTLSKG